jgi:hypothetical protein
LGLDECTTRVGSGHAGTWYQCDLDLAIRRAPSRASASGERGRHRSAERDVPTSATVFSTRWRSNWRPTRCVRLPLAAGADIDRRNDYNGDNALGWAEYVLARERPGDAGVRDLLRNLGSRPVVWGA